MSDEPKYPPIAGELPSKSVAVPGHDDSQDPITVQEAESRGIFSEMVGGVKMEGPEVPVSAADAEAAKNPQGAEQAAEEPKPTGAKASDSGKK